MLLARRALPLAMTAAILTACNGNEPRRTEAEPSPEPSATSSTPTTPSTPSTPSTPTTPSPSEYVAEQPVPRDAPGLARELGDAVATLRDPDATNAEVQQAGEFQQLAVSALATAPDTFRRNVTDRLSPETATSIRSEVRAARLLRAMTDPQRKFPRWRIVAAPPASTLLGYYREAQRRTGVPWTYLAAIHLVETRMGRIRGPSSAGALGPMQFLPSTWARYGAGGDINDPRDAIQAAARLLRANGAPGDMAEALWHYNPSDNYVGAVTEYARTMQRSGPSAYRGYWHWRVLYRHVRGTYVLPDGYPKARPVLVAAQ